MYFFRFNVQKRRYTVKRQGNKADGKDDVIKRRQ